MQRLSRYQWLAWLALVGLALSCQDPMAPDGAGGQGTGGQSTGGQATGGALESGGSGGTSVESGGVSGGGIAGAGGGGSGGTAAGGEAAGSGGVPGCTDGGQGSLGEPDVDGFAVELTMASELDENAPSTVGILEWALDRPCLRAAEVEFGLDTSYGRTAPVDLTKEHRRTVLWGMKPEQTYHYRIVASDDDGTYTSDDYTLTTGAAPELPIDGFTVASSNADHGFLLGTFWTIGTASVQDDLWTAFVLDTEGDLVWWHTYEREVVGEMGYARLRLSADNQNLWFAQTSNGGGALYRVSIDTLDQQLYEDTVASHDICAVSGSTMAYLDYGALGCETIVEIDETGTTRLVFDPTELEGFEGGCHGNSVRYSATEDVYLYSSRNEDVLIVTRDGQLQWRLSEKVPSGNLAWGGQQHGTHLLDSSILIHANYTEDKTAKVFEYSLDGELLATFPTENTGLNASFLGDVQRLPSGNTLITSGNRAWIVTPLGEVPLDMIMSGGPWFGYLEFRTDLYGPPDDIWQ
jgi:hypothetical protein